MASFQIPEAFEPMLLPARHKAFFGGRGSAKSHSFAEALIIRMLERKTRALGLREIQKSIRESVHALLAEKIAKYNLGASFRVLDTEIRGPNGGLVTFAGLKSNPDQVKSTEGVDVAWVEEANRVSRRSLDLLIPTVRADDSELWFGWNPESELDPVDLMFRGPRPPPDSVIRRVSFRDNPWFPSVLEQERLYCRETDPEKYQHVWEGGYRQAAEGAYYARQLADAANAGRIGRVPYDPAAPVHVAFDLGIGDATAIWFAQRVGREMHLIDFLENTGVGLEWYARELRSRPYVYAEEIILPHDAKARELGTGKSRQEVLEGFGFRSRICPQISVQDGIDAVRRLLTTAWIDDGNCADGLRALREYREAWDENRRVSRGPLHDWTSHAADALRYLAVGLEPEQQEHSTPYRLPQGIGSWMS